jgi:hypothetical protein
VADLLAVRDDTAVEDDDTADGRAHGSRVRPR